MAMSPRYEGGIHRAWSQAAARRGSIQPAVPGYSVSSVSLSHPGIAESQYEVKLFGSSLESLLR
jgi:hypothetical protein